MPFRVCPLSKPKEHLGPSLQKSQCWDRTPKSGCLRWQAQLYKTGSENLKGSFNIRRDRNHLANPPPPTFWGAQRGQGMANVQKPLILTSACVCFQRPQSQQQIKGLWSPRDAQMRRASPWRVWTSPGGSSPRVLRPTPATATYQCRHSRRPAPQSRCGSSLGGNADSAGLECCVCS